MDDVSGLKYPIPVSEEAPPNSFGPNTPDIHSALVVGHDERVDTNCFAPYQATPSIDNPPSDTVLNRMPSVEGVPVSEQVRYNSYRENTSDIQSAIGPGDNEGVETNHLAPHQATPSIVHPQADVVHAVSEWWGVNARSSPVCFPMSGASTELKVPYNESGSLDLRSEDFPLTGSAVSGTRQHDHNTAEPSGSLLADASVSNQGAYEPLPLSRPPTNNKRAEAAAVPAAAAVAAALFPGKEDMKSSDKGKKNDGSSGQEKGNSQSYNGTKGSAGPEQIRLESMGVFGPKVITIHGLDKLGPNIQIGDHNQMFINGGRASNNVPPNFRMPSFNMPPFPQHTSKGFSYSTGGGANVQGSSKPKQRITVPDGLVTEIILQIVADNLHSDWRRVGRRLCLNDNQLENTKLDYQNEGGVKEVAYQVLRMWRDQSGSKATTQHLATVLAQSGRGDIAKKLSVEALNKQKH